MTASTSRPPPQKERPPQWRTAPTLPVRLPRRKRSQLSFVPEAPADRGEEMTWEAGREVDWRRRLGMQCCFKDGRVYTPDVVRKAEDRIFLKNLDKEYERFDGPIDFKHAAASFLFGSHHPILQQGRVVTLQSLAGTGALRLVAECVRKFLPDAIVYLPDRSHPHHDAIFFDAGVPTKTYRYDDDQNGILNFETMTDDIEAVPEGSVVLLQGCAQYPTGIDPTKEQWSHIGDLCLTRRCYPLIDMSHHGFASGSFEDDAYVPRLFSDKGLNFMVTQSYSKNLGLYNERIGALHFVVEDAVEADRLLMEMMRIVLGLSAFPLLRGARIVTEILEDLELKREWEEEMMTMHRRLSIVREGVHDALVNAVPERDWSGMKHQRGLYAHLDLSTDQIDRLRERHRIFVADHGSLSLSAVSMEHLSPLVEAIADCF